MFGSAESLSRKRYGYDIVCGQFKLTVVDGDKLLVVADKTLIEVAERNLEKYNIVPLYYNMQKAPGVFIDNEAIYNGLNAAFVNGNIGIYSNNISKIWNSEVFIKGTYEEKKQAIDVIKLLCMENNHCIDAAKTLYMPTRVDAAKPLIAKFTKNSLPYFFKYAKDKEEWQVEPINDSFVNKLNSIIPNPRICCKYVKEGKKIKLEKPDYKLLMSNPNINVAIVKSDTGQLIEGTNPVVLKYVEFAQKYGRKINTINKTELSFSPTLSKTEIRRTVLYSNVIKETKRELSKYGYSDNEVADILVKYLYEIKESKHKDLLWTCYGDYLFRNLNKTKKLVSKSVQCDDCGKWFEVKPKDNYTNKCPECYLKYRREYYRENKRKAREKAKLSTAEEILKSL